MHIVFNLPECTGFEPESTSNIYNKAFKYALFKTLSAPDLAPYSVSSLIINYLSLSSSSPSISYK